MRALLAFTFVIGVIGGVPAPADADDFAVLGPVGSGDVESVTAALSKAGVKRMRTDMNCLADPGCLAKLGKELGVKSAIGVEVMAGNKLSLTIVDVTGQLLLGTRDIEIPRKRLAKEIGSTLAKVVEEMTIAKAKTLFAEGNQHYNLGEFAPALERYKLAYRVRPLPAFQFNIAQCHRKLGQHQEAVSMYQAFLVDVPEAENKAMIESLIAESKAAHAEKLAALERLEREKLDAEKKKAEEARKAREAEAAAAAERAKAEQAQIAAEREREKLYNRHPARRWMLLTGTLGLATVGVGTYFGVQARDAQRAFDTAGCGDIDQRLAADMLASCRDNRERGERAALLGNVLLASGGVIAIGSLIVYALDPGNIERPSQIRTSVSVTARSVQVVLRW